MLNTYGDARALLSFGSARALLMRMNCVLFVIYLVVSAISSLVGGESNTIGFEHGIRWLTCVQGAPVPLGVTGAEMNERGKPEAVWPARWMAPNKTEGKNHANPPSTRVRVPAPPREGRTTKQHTNGGSGGNRASETDQYYELATEPERIHRATPNVTQKLAQTQASTTVGGPGPELEGRRQRQHRTRTADNGLDGNNTAPSVPEHVR